MFLPSLVVRLSPFLVPFAKSLNTLTRRLHFGKNLFALYSTPPFDSLQNIASVIDQWKNPNRVPW